MAEPKTIQTIADLRPDPDNANLGTERGLRVLDDSLRECGAGRSILADRDGTVIAGNKTLERAADIGLPVRVIKTDGTELVVVQRTDLDLAGDDGQRERARRLAYLDNFSSEQGLRWDAEQILSDLEAGVNLDGLWRDDELTELLAGLVQPEAVEDPGAQLSKADELQQKWQVQTGDVWQCGEHRICCGDCTDAAVVEMVMKGERAGAVVTDPPYGINLDTDLSDIHTDWKGWKGQGGQYPPVEGDDKPYDPAHLFRDFDYCEEMFLWGADYYSERIPKKNEGSLLVWDKRVNQSSGASLSWGLGSEFEICWSRKRHKRQLIRKLWSGLYGTETQDVRERVHPTQKPLEVIEWIIERYIDENAIVWDGFAGSGTTGVACERLGRQARMIEIHPPYCSVILERLSQMGLDCRKVAGA